VYRVPDDEDQRGIARRREELVLARMAAERAVRPDGWWFSHTSAALLWGCWTWQLADEVHTTQLSRPDVPAWDRTIRRHWTRLPERDRTMLDGVPVTSLERTAVDCARALRPDQAVVIVDSALRLGADPAVIATILEECAGKRGVRAARYVVALADGVVESGGESLLRWVIHRTGLPVPRASILVQTWSGPRWVDLGWEHLKLGFEFDGAVKYDGTFGDPRRALLAEKSRHDALVEEGWRLIRVTWDDLLHPERLIARVRAVLPHRGR
jgi:hypothetical protein